MTTPDISVVTVCFNAAATIRRTIDSVLGQTGPSVEYLVVDGGSTDGTIEILQSYGTQLSYLSEPDAGIYDAMNKGVSRARGRWIHLLNADDWYAAPDALARAVPHLDPDRTTYFDLLRVYADGTTLLQSRDVKRWMLYVSAFLPHPSLIVSREQYENVGRFDPNLRIAADHDFILRLTKQYPPKHVPITLTHMAQEGLSARHLDVSMKEFATVVQRHGLPAPFVRLLTALRTVWWRARANIR